eukprot:CAMPEP_0168349810 /NCGR_PEP_ID=MMETSP0213-20121227/20673_1 /TAXON_ID=151035 /ORGANISM="Euplotes harpa, Strain FSP1.4" /LENGTH=59 /DNA_ID=CAMNT_0008359893 /DNA_START=28 /DNA_END=207 /DNA_ORIENTATION=+
MSAMNTENNAFTIEAVKPSNIRQNSKSRESSRLRRLLSPKQRQIIQSRKNLDKSEEETK